MSLGKIKKTPKIPKIILCFCVFLCFFILGKTAISSDVTNEWRILVDTENEQLSFPVAWGNIYKTDLKIKWQDCSKKYISSDWQEVDRSEGVQIHNKKFTPPQKACFAEIFLSGNNGIQDFFWTTEVKFRTVVAEICGDGICQSGEDLGNCPTDCTQKVKVDWKQLPIRSSWQKSKNLFGGEGMQMVMDIDWNLHDSNILYLTTDTTKVWKSIDRGVNWFQVMKNSRTLGGVSIVSDPNNKDVVFLAASMSIEGASSYYDGIYRSVDGGETWVGPIGEEINFKKRHAGKLFIIDKSTFNGFQSSTIYAGTPKGLLVSNDGGVIWKTAALGGVDIYSIDWSGEGSENIYISTESGLYKYSITHNRVDLIGDELPQHPWGIAVDKNNSSIIFVTVGTEGVWKSTDAGNSFERVWNNLYPDLNYQRILISDNDSSHIYASPHMIGGHYPLLTRDGGENWSPPSYVHQEEWIGEGYYYAKPIAFDPENGDIAISHSDGPIIKTYDGGNTWHYSGSGYTGARVNDIDFVSENISLLCLTDYGVLTSNNNNDTFEDLNAPRINGEKSCGAMDSYGDKIVATIGTWSKQNILISNDFGVSWVDVYNIQYDFKFVQFNNDNENIIYTDKWVSFDGGETWKNVGNNYKIFAVNHKNGNIVYGARDKSNNSWAIGISLDNGMTWTQLGDDLLASSIEDIAVDPFSESNHILVAAVDKMIYEYKNSKWRHINTSRGLKADYSEGIYHVEFDPVQKGIVWAAQRSNLGHGHGVYVSDTNGLSWIYAESNFGDYNNIWNIDISPFDSRIFVTGAGLWTHSLSMCDGKICEVCSGVDCDNFEKQTEVETEIPIISELKITITTDTKLGFRDEAMILISDPVFQNFDDTKIKIYNSVLHESEATLSAKDKYSLATFINIGTVSTKILGSGERAAVLHSYKSSFGRLPISDSDWEDIIKIANGRWPDERSKESEKKAINVFKKIYLRNPDTNNQHDDSALKLIAYGLRPTKRNMDSEKFAINAFKNIFGHNPKLTFEWDTMRAIAYSGAKR
jgi:photosystem II stability/assembly factor-like uncharacterized protein